EIVADVVANEREHGHRIAADDTDLAARGSGGFAAERGAEINAVHPVERLENQRDVFAPPATEDDGGNQNPGGIVGGGIQRRIVCHRSGESAVGMSGFSTAFG